jgi:hypothetical protein
MTTRGHRAFEKQLNPWRPSKLHLYVEQRIVVFALTEFEECSKMDWKFFVGKEPQGK